MKLKPRKSEVHHSLHSPLKLYVNRRTQVLPSMSKCPCFCTSSPCPESLQKVKPVKENIRAWVWRQATLSDPYSLAPFH